MHHVVTCQVTSRTQDLKTSVTYFREDILHRDTDPADLRYEEGSLVRMQHITRGMPGVLYYKWQNKEWHMSYYAVKWC